MPADRAFPPPLGDERAVTTGWLDWQRATVHRKCAGLDDEAAFARPVPASALSVAAVVSHLRWVEWGWFQRSFLGSTAGGPAPDDGWTMAGDEGLADLLDAYAAECQRSREVVAAHDLDDVEAYAPEGIEPVSMRWILGHVTEETARHLGHLDLLREAIDGVRGY